MNICLIILLLFTSCLFGGLDHLYGSEEKVAERIHAHILVRDYASACQEAKEGVAQHSESRVLWEAWLQALAKKGDEKETGTVWNQYLERFPDGCSRRDLLEHLAWGVIENGAHSASPLTRLLALLGAFYSQDAKGVALLHRALSDSNAYVRGTSVKLASHLRDAKLKAEIVRLFKKESNWQVRLEVIKALGKMHIEEAKPDLVALIGSSRSQAEEKAVAISSLVNLLDTAEKAEVEKLAKSDRGDLRLLACELIEHFELKRDVDLLLPLLQDTRADVRAAAWHALGSLRVHTPSFFSLASKALKDPDPATAITAAWALTLVDPTAGQEALAPWLKDDRAEVRRLAAAALVATGPYGLPLAQKTFLTSDDPYVRLNIALGLLGERVSTDKACEALAKGLFQYEERWMWQEESLFQALAPSDIKHNEAIPNYPEAVNQMVRLEILNRLAIMRYPRTHEALRRYLKEKRWEISGMAAFLLLTEGDETAVDAVQELLKDPDQKVRNNAALVLAQWGRGDEVIQMLQEAYEGADREMKEMILEGLGRAGVATSIPFLAAKLQEPYPALRLIAAAALLQTLYH